MDGSKSPGYQSLNEEVRGPMPPTIGSIKQSNTGRAWFGGQEEEEEEEEIY